MRAPRLLLATAVAASGLVATPAEAGHYIKAGVTGTRVGPNGVVAVCTAVAQPVTAFVSVWCTSDAGETFGTGPAAAAAPVAGVHSTRVCWFAHAVYVQQTDVFSSGCRDL